jgi:hypothetical protein
MISALQNEEQTLKFPFNSFEAGQLAMENLAESLSTGGGSRVYFPGK